MEDILIVIVVFSGGVVVGGAFGAFIVLLEIIPRLVHISKTKDYIKIYQNAYILGMVFFTILYFYDIVFKLGNIGIGIIGLIMGTYTGMFSSALAEVLNVVPVMSKKLKTKDKSKLIVYVLLFGKVAGSLYYWLIYK